MGVSRTTITSREFNQDVAGAKRAASAGPVVVTDRGRPSLVLLTYERWLELTGSTVSLAEALAGSLEAAEVDFEPERDRSLSMGADLE